VTVLDGVTPADDLIAQARRTMAQENLDLRQQHRRREQQATEAFDAYLQLQHEPHVWYIVNSTLSNDVQSLVAARIAAHAGAAATAPPATQPETEAVPATPVVTSTEVPAATVTTVDPATGATVPVQPTAETNRGQLYIPPDEKELPKGVSVPTGASKTLLNDGKVVAWQMPDGTVTVSSKKMTRNVPRTEWDASEAKVIESVTPKSLGSMFTPSPHRD
jgi:hypothetical protein